MIEPNDNTRKANERYDEIMAGVRYDLKCINSYCLINRRKPNVYDRNWADVGSVAHVVELLEEVMKFLDIDPNTKSY
ncbi:hypothetical protein FACS189431_2070 [Alphaproteobacteria bacterium]|nr:hypothetical protein FACS189431_2070 [Alphaproteobacteria bacterium]